MERNMQYWVMKNGVQQGPLSIEELEAINLSGEDYVWFNGMDDWAKAKNIADLHAILNSQATQSAETAAAAEETPEEAPVEDKASAPIEASEVEASEVEAEAEVETEAAAVAEKAAEEEANPSTPPIYSPGDPFQPSYVEQQVQPAAQKCPSTHLALSILMTLLCCMIPGVVAIVYSAQVSSKYKEGDYEGAKKASENAEMWNIISFSLGIIYLPFAIIFSLL